MRVLLYNPDNGVTRNFMPHLWMFLLKALTPPGHEVILVDGNARAMMEEELVRFVRREGIGLVGIGAMTRVVARLFFRGIYFPQMTRRAWLRLLYENRRTIRALACEGFLRWRESRRRTAGAASAVTAPSASGD